MDFDDFYIFKPSINSVIHNSWFYNRKLSKPEKTVELFFLNSVINARSKKKILIPLFVFSGFAIFVLSIPLIVKFSVNDKIFTNINSVPAKQFAIVLGVGLRPDGTPGTYLRSRLDDAVKLYKGNNVEKILLLGDNGIKSYDEISAMNKYLLFQKVPQDIIFGDYAGFYTFSTMSRAQKIFDIKSAVIVSQKFHLTRAVYIAQNKNLNPVGFSTSAKGGKKYIVREW